MAKLSEKYESVLVLSTKASEEEIKALVEKFSDLIAKHGELESVDEWGKRRLAYPIQYETEGYYVLFTFACAPDFPAELDRVYNITDGILRSLIVKRVEA